MCKKNDIQNWGNFFIANHKSFPIFRGFEQLSSSICRQVMASHFSLRGQSYVLCNFLLLSKTIFSSQNYRSSYGGTPIKGFKIANFSLVSNKKLNQKGSLCWRPGPGKLGQKCETPPLLTSPTENPKPETKLLPIL